MKSWKQIKRPADILYGVNDKPPFHILLLSGLQQAIVMCTYLVIVYIILSVGNVSQLIIIHILSMSLIALAISTLLQIIWKGPIGSGYLAPPVISAIYLHPSLQAIHMGGISLLFGMTIFAGIIEFLVGLILPKLRFIFTAGVIGLMIMMIGIVLGMVGLEQVLDITKIGTPDFVTHLVVAFITLLFMIIVTLWFKGLLKLLGAFGGIIIGGLLSCFFGLIEPSKIKLWHHISIFALPRIESFHFSFDYRLAIPFLISGAAAAVRVMGCITTSQTINDDNWKTSDLYSIRGGVFADGIGCAISGLLGCTGISSGPTLIGISKLTGMTSRYTAFVIAPLLAIIAFFPKIVALFTLVPIFILGTVIVFNGAFMLLGGIQIIASKPITNRTLLVVGISLLFGLSRLVFKDYYQALPDFVKIFTGTELSITMIVACILTLLFRIGIHKHLVISHADQRITIQSSQSLFEEKVKGWKVPENVLKRAGDVCDNILRNLSMIGDSDKSVQLSIDFDQVTLDITIEYQGDLIDLSSMNVQKIQYLIEEQAFSQGLSRLMQGAIPDRYSLKRKKDVWHIHLQFFI